MANQVKHEHMIDEHIFVLYYLSRCQQHEIKELRSVMEGSEGRDPRHFFLERLFHERTARIPQQIKALPGKD